MLSIFTNLLGHRPTERVFNPISRCHGGPGTAADTRRRRGVMRLLLETKISQQKSVSESAELASITQDPWPFECELYTVATAASGF